MPDEKSEPGLIERAEKVRDEIKKEKAELEALKAETILGGVTQAGQSSPVKKEITPREYAKAADKGIILE